VVVLVVDVACQKDEDRASQQVSPDVHSLRVEGEDGLEAGHCIPKRGSIPLLEAVIVLHPLGNFRVGQEVHLSCRGD